MRFVYLTGLTSKPRHHVADMEIVFDEAGPLAGMRLTGFAIWTRKDGSPGMSVTLPSRMFEGKEGETRYDFLREAEEGTLKRFQAAVLADFRREHPELAGVANSSYIRGSGTNGGNTRRSQPRGQEQRG